MSTLDQIATKIIKEQELIMGPIAWFQAAKVKGVRIIDQKTGTVTLENGDGRLVIDGLVSQYEHLFGRASHEVCKEAAASLLVGLSPNEIPSSLK